MTPSVEEPGRGLDVKREDVLGVELGWGLRREVTFGSQGKKRETFLLFQDLPE